jgi:hypothetical protein
MAELCVALGVAPAVYWAMTLAERSAIVDALNRARRDR